MPEEEERQDRTEEIVEAIMTENFQILRSDIKPQIQKSHQSE